MVEKTLQHIRSNVRLPIVALDNQLVANGNHLVALDIDTT